MLRWWVASSFLLALALACDASQDDGSADAPNDDGAACQASEDPAQLTIENRTGNLIEVITMRACDGSDLVDYPIPSPGLANGEDATINFPKPGCWILNYGGEGCSADPLHQTPPEGVCGGDTFVWTPGSDTHLCAGAGW